MSEEESFKMKATDVVPVPPKGVYAFGVVESGVIRAGDEVEIRSLGRATRATVDRVEINYKPVEQAGVGESIALIFNRLGRNDLEDGALIVEPGAELTEEDSLPAPEIKPDYSTLPMRQRPPIGRRDYTGPIVNLVIGLVFLLITLLSIPTIRDGTLFQKLNIAWGVVGLVMIFFAVQKIIRMRRIEAVFAGGNASAPAMILDKWYDEGRSRTAYYLAFEFEPTQAGAGPGKLAYKGEVPEIVWRKVAVGGRITVRYAKADPQMIILVAE